MAQPLLADRRGALRRRAGRRRGDRAGLPGRGRRRPGRASTTTRCPRWSTCATRPRDEVLLFPEAGTNTVVHVRRARTLDEDAVRRLRGRGHPARSPTSGSPPAPLEGRAAAAVCGEDGRLTAVGPAPRPRSRTRRDRRLARAWTPERPARHHPRRRRRVRRQDRRRPRARVVVGGRAGSSAGAVRWTETRSENMVGDDPRPRPSVQTRHDRRTPRRQHPGLPAGRAPGQRRLPADRRGPADA